MFIVMVGLSQWLSAAKRIGAKIKIRGIAPVFERIDCFSERLCTTMMRYNKKALLVMLVGLLACAIGAVGFASEYQDSALMPENLSESDIIGVWRLTTMIVEGSSMSPESLGIEMRYEFQADHTALGTYEGRLGDSGSATETWTLDARQALVYANGKPLVKVRCEDGTLFLLMDEEINAEAGGILVFTCMDNP